MAQRAVSLGVDLSHAETPTARVSEWWRGKTDEERMALVNLVLIFTGAYGPRYPVTLVTYSCPCGKFRQEQLKGWLQPSA